MFSAWDTALFSWANGLAGQSAAFDTLVRFCAEPLIWLMAAAALARSLMLIVRRDGRRATELASLGHAAGATVLALALIRVFGLFFWYRPRPFDALHDVTLLANPPYGLASFPSSHAAAAFAIAYSVWFVDRRAGGPLVACAYAVALGRVIGGVHYPFDVVAGAVLGVAIAHTMWIVGTAVHDERLVSPLADLPSLREDFPDELRPRTVCKTVRRAPARAVSTSAAEKRGPRTMAARARAPKMKNPNQ